MPNAEYLRILRQGASVWNEWRSQNVWFLGDLNDANLRGANLRDSDLTGIRLHKANLRKANLSGAKLADADLSEADLCGADLNRANLNKARLEEANLTRADLRRANLSEADLSRANFSEARLEGTNFASAKFGYTLLANINLGEALGLDWAEHRGPSTIGLDTFFASMGKIPDIFLRGAGIPNVFLEYATSLVAIPFEFYSCFISYSHVDKSFARRVHDTLQGRGIRCWLDEKQLFPGDHIHREIDEAVRLWDKVLLCCSEKSLTSWWVDKEVSKALKKEEQLWKERGKPVLAIIPLNLDGYLFDPQWQDWKKQHLTDRLAADFTGWETDSAKFEEQIERVLKALRADAGARQPPPKSRL